MTTGHPNAIFIEVRGSTAGLAVPEPEGFRFIAADRRFTILDGSRFRRLHALRQAAWQLDTIASAPLPEAE